jgi:HK97 gp10 family phage protein
MASNRVRIVGIEQLSRNMLRVTDVIRQRVEGAVVGGSENVARLARSAVRRRSGTLHDSIRIEREEGATSCAVVAGGRRAPHAHLIEGGTVRMRAYPYLRPALEQEAPRIVSAIDAAVGDAL